MQFRMSAWLLSLLLHGVVIALLVYRVNLGTSLEAGSGFDILETEQGIRVEAMYMPGSDRENSAAVDEVPANAPAEEAKPPEPDEPAVVASTSGEAVEARTDEVRETPPPAPQPVEARVEPVPAAEFRQQNLSAARTGGDSAPFLRYQGMLFKQFQRKKLDPQTSRRGKVLIRFTLDVTGQVLSREIAASSGSKILDDSALASFDRAVPLPPVPAAVSAVPLTLNVPFDYMTQ